MSSVDGPRMRRARTRRLHNREERPIALKTVHCISGDANEVLGDQLYPFGLHWRGTPSCGQTAAAQLDFVSATSHVL